MTSKYLFLIPILALSGVIACQPEKMEVQTNPSKSGQRALAPEEATGQFPYRRLSTYGFFEGEMAQLNPSEKLIPYQPASSLFTDYAMK